MATIGSVTKRDDGRYEGELRTLSIHAEIALVPVTDKASPNQPDYRVVSQGIEIGAGWVRKGQMSGKDYVSLSIAAPEFGAKTLYANLGRAAGQTDPDVYALIWSPPDRLSLALAPQKTRGLFLSYSRSLPPTRPAATSQGRALSQSHGVDPGLHLRKCCPDRTTRGTRGPRSTDGRRSSDRLGQ
jgi:uncharacterized protein (DUF736 family)